jgi:hypothetical protein
MAGVAPSFTFPNGWILMGELSDRNFTGNVPTNVNGQTMAFDKSFLQYAIEGQAKPLLALDVDMRFQHDIMPFAFEVANNITVNTVSANAVYSLFDWWNLWVSGQQDDISDGNTRDFLKLTSDWLIWDGPGLHAGLGYSYANATDLSTAYWTPYRLNRYFAELALRGNYLRMYYNLQLLYGIGKESVRPEAEQAYMAELQEAQAEAWPLNTYPTPPTEGWQPVVGASASSTIKLGEHWEVQGEISYNKVPDYNEVNITGGLKYHF